MSDPLKMFKGGPAFSVGEKARLRQICRPSGKSLILPYDQFIEHDCRHLEAESDAGNPNHIMDLAIEGGYNAVTVHYGVARRYWTNYEGQVPLILKINGKTSIPPDNAALSVHTSFVEDALRIGAMGIGYTLYYGSPAQDRDLPQLAKVRADCERYGLPLVVWAYPRGEAINAKGGRDSSYAVESATRLAMEMGASVIKANQPKPSPDLVDNTKVPQYFRDLEKELLAMDPEEAELERAKRVVAAAQGVPVLFSGGSKVSDDDLIKKAKTAVKAGCFGFIFGRNMWKRPKADALKISAEVGKLLDEG